MDGLVKNSCVVLLDLEKNKIDNEGAATLALMMRQNSTIREVNLFGQAGRAFGDACLTAFVDMFAYNVTLTKIIWRLDSRKSFAINKLLVRNNTIRKNLEENRDISKIIPVHCNIPELLSKRAAGPANAEEESVAEEEETSVAAEEPKVEAAALAPAASDSQIESSVESAESSVVEEEHVSENLERVSSDAIATEAPKVAEGDATEVTAVAPEKAVSAPVVLKKAPADGNVAHNKELNKSPKTAIAAAAANDPGYDILDLSGNTMFLMKHRDYAKELGQALAKNTVIREVHLKAVDLDKV
jgi:hypothetical protein